MFLLPIVCLLITCASAAWVVLKLRDRKLAAALLALVCGVYAAFLFWGLMSDWHEIAIGIMALTLLLGTAIGCAACRVGDRRRRTDDAMAYAVIFGLAIAAPVMLMWQFTQPAEVRYSVSPDGAYIAKVSDYDDYDDQWQVATVGDTGWRPYFRKPKEIGFAFRWMKRVWWKSNRTLLVDYDGGDDPATAGTVIERKVTKWRDVEITYRDVHVRQAR